jgi:bromodomain-containing protein 7
MRLVTANAKQFNPPGSIYYTEAERIEAWAADQITKAAATVIEYETSWKLDVDGEEEEEPEGEDDHDFPQQPTLAQEHAASPAPMTADDELRALHAAAVAAGRRPPQRAVVKKIEMERAKELEKEKEKEKLAEKPIENTLDEDGHMPGYKVGIGVFPPDSGWSEVMLALKLKGT